MRWSAVLACALALPLPAGCGRPSAPAVEAPAPPVVSRREVTPFERLAVADSVSFVVEAGTRSLAVVEHYDALLKSQGWKRQPGGAGAAVGQRQWLSVGARAGPTDVYDAAWTHPATGRTAVLNLWHSAGEENRQHGTFEIEK